MKKEYPLYGGKTILEFNDARHIYSVNGKTVYGVTSIIGILDKPALKYWAVNKAIEHLENNLHAGVALDEFQIKTLLGDAKRAHTVRLSKAADLGTLIHDWIEKYVDARIDKKEPPKRPINPEMKKAINGFFKWAKTKKVGLIANEQKIYSRKYKYAGTYDLEALVGGKRTIIDFKTGKAIYPEMFLQAAAYLQAKEEETGKKYDGGVAILRLSKADKEITPFEVKYLTRKEVEKYIKVFVACLRVYEWKRELKKEEIINGSK